MSESEFPVVPDDENRLSNREEVELIEEEREDGNQNVLEGSSEVTPQDVDAAVDAAGRDLPSPDPSLSGSEALVEGTYVNVEHDVDEDDDNEDEEG